MHERLAMTALVGAMALGWSPARASPKLSPAADEALSSAEDLLDHKKGDARVFACVDALPFLVIVFQSAPDYAYSDRLYADCLYRTRSWAPAEKIYRHYLTLVPSSARHGEVLRMVREAQERVEFCRKMLGYPTAALPGGSAVAGRSPTPTGRPAASLSPTGSPAPKQTEVGARPSVRTASGASTARVAPAMAELHRPSTGSGSFVLPPLPPPPMPRIGETKKPAEGRSSPPAGRPRARQLIVRAGSSPTAGSVGVSVEGKLGLVGLSLGTGAYPLSVGLSFSNAAGGAGPYADVFLLLDRSSLFVHRDGSRIAAGATVGWDFRPWRHVSLEAGVGGAYDKFLGGPIVTWDLCAGYVFEL